MFQFGVFTTVENHEIGYPQQTQEHSKIRMVQVICQVNFYDFFKKIYPLAPNEGRNNWCHLRLRDFDFETFRDFF